MSALFVHPFSTISVYANKTINTRRLDPSNFPFDPLNQSFHHNNISIPGLGISCDAGEFDWHPIVSFRSARVGGVRIVPDCWEDKSAQDDSGFPGIRGLRDWDAPVHKWNSADYSVQVLRKPAHGLVLMGGKASSPDSSAVVAVTLQGVAFHQHSAYSANISQQSTLGIGSVMQASSSSLPSIKLCSVNPQAQNQPIHIQHTNLSLPINISIVAGGGDGNYGNGRGGGGGGGGGRGGDNNDPKDKPSSDDSGIPRPLLSTWLEAAGRQLPSTLVSVFIMTFTVKYLSEPKASASSYSLHSILSLLNLLGTWARDSKVVLLWGKRWKRVAGQ